MTTASNASGHGATPSGTRVEARVSLGFWWVAACMCVVFTVILACALLGVPKSFFDDQSPMLGFLRIVSVVGLPLSAYAAWFYLNGALRPQPVTLDEQGVATPAWTLTWDEVLQARVLPSEGELPHKQQLAFHVTDEAFRRVRSANSGHSGRPFSMGGLAAIRPIVRTQFGVNPMAAELLPVVEEHLQATHGDRRPPRWPY